VVVTDRHHSVLDSDVRFGRKGDNAAFLDVAFRANRFDAGPTVAGQSAEIADALKLATAQGDHLHAQRDFDSVSLDFARVFTLILEIGICLFGIKYAFFLSETGAVSCRSQDQAHQEHAEPVRTHE